MKKVLVLAISFLGSMNAGLLNYLRENNFDGAYIAYLSEKIRQEEERLLSEESIEIREVFSQEFPQLEWGKTASLKDLFDHIQKVDSFKNEISNSRYNFQFTNPRTIYLISYIQRQMNGVTFKHHRNLLEKEKLEKSVDKGIFLLN